VRATNQVQEKGRAANKARKNGRSPHVRICFVFNHECSYRQSLAFFTLPHET